MKRWALRALLVAGASVLALLATELILRATHPLARGWFVWPPGLRARFAPAAGLFPGVAGEVHLSIDSLGLRGDELPDDAARRILTLGGSTTECLYLDQNESWPGLVQQLLNERSPSTRAWVGNAGRSGHTTREHVFQVEELLKVVSSVDTVVVLAGINDLGRRLARGAAYDPHFLDSPGASDIARHDAFQVRPLGVDEGGSWFARTAIGRLTNTYRRNARSKEDSAAPKQHAQGYDGKIIAVWRRHRQGAAHLIDELPDLTDALAEYQRNLARIVDSARSANARIVLLTQPTMWRADLPSELQSLLWMGGIGDFQAKPGSDYYTVRALAEGMRLYNEAMLALARERGVECVDLAALLAGDDAAFYDDCHFNEHGARRVAEALAERW